MDNNTDRGLIYNYGHGCHAPSNILLQQVVGIAQEQKIIDVCLTVPRNKPSIEQIIDVFVKHLCINNVKIRCNEVIVCGNFEVKGIYVACKPAQPVHAIEAKHIRFSVPIIIPGVNSCMEADATVRVEYIDYDCDKRSRPYWYKEQEKKYMEHYCQDDCDHDSHHDCDHDCHHDCDHDYEHCHVPCHKKCSRKFHVTVVLCVNVKVMTPREVILHPPYPHYPHFPIKPKG